MHWKESFFSLNYSDLNYQMELLVIQENDAIEILFVFHSKFPR